MRPYLFTLISKNDQFICLALIGMDINLKTCNNGKKKVSSYNHNFSD